MNISSYLVYIHVFTKQYVLWINENVFTYSPTKLIRIDVLSYRIFKLKIKYDEDVSKMHVYPPTDITFQNTTRLRKKYHSIPCRETILLIYS